MNNSFLDSFGFFSQPSLINPLEAEAIIQKVEAVCPTEKDMQAFSMFSSDGMMSEYDNINGSAIIPVVGGLSKDINIISYLLGWSTYTGIRSQVESAIKDDSVESITLMIDSCGGQASGVADLVDFLNTAGAQKPVQAFVNGSACSAAYWITSAAEEVTISQDSILGSIGTILCMRDRTEANQKEGIKVHVFTSGAAKADGHPDKSMTSDAAERMQALVDNMNSLFISSVAKNRGMKEEYIKDMEARVYFGQESIEMGLADQIGTLEKVLTTKGGSMPKKEATPQAESNEITQAMLESAVAEAKAEAMTEGINAERSRVAEIEAFTVLADVAAQAKAEGWDKGTFLEAQTKAMQERKVTEEPKTDPKAAHIEALREAEGEAPIVRTVAASAPEVKEEITKLDKTATDEEIKAAFEGSEYIKSEFKTLDTFASLVKFSGYEKEVN